MRSMRVYRKKHDKCGRPARPHTQTGSGPRPFQDWHVNESSKLYRATINPSQDGVQTLGSVVVGVKFYPTNQPNSLTHSILLYRTLPTYIQNTLTLSVCARARGDARICPDWFTLYPKSKFCLAP